MNNKTIIEFGFRIIWRIMEISEGVIRRTLLDFPNSSYDTQPHSLIVNYATVGIEKLTFGIHHELVIYYFHNLDWFGGVIFG